MRAASARESDARARDETTDAIRGETRGRCALCLWFLFFFCFRVVGTGRARVGVFETPRDEGDARLTSGF